MFNSLDDLMVINDCILSNNTLRLTSNPNNVYIGIGLGYKPKPYVIGGAITNENNIWDKIDKYKNNNDAYKLQELYNKILDNENYVNSNYDNDEERIKDLETYNRMEDKINNYIMDIKGEEIETSKEIKASDFREKKLKEKSIEGLKENIDYQQNYILNNVEKYSKQYSIDKPYITKPIYIGEKIDEEIQQQKELLNYLSNSSSNNYYNTKDINSPHYTPFVKNTLSKLKTYDGEPMLNYMLVDAIGDDNVIEHKYRDKTYNDWKKQGYILINKEKIEGNNNFIPYYKKNNNNIKLENIYYVEKKPKTWENNKPKTFEIVKKERTLNNDNNDYNWIFTTKTRELSYNPLNSNNILFYEEKNPNILLKKEQLINGKSYRGIMNFDKNWGDYKIPFKELKRNIKI